MRRDFSFSYRLPSSTIHSTAHTPVAKPLHSVGSRMHSSWAAAASDPSDECMVTVSTLERQHMASWSGTTTSGRATLSRGSHRRLGTDPPTNNTEKREHCECLSPREHIQTRVIHNGSTLMQAVVSGNQLFAHFPETLFRF